MPEEPQSAGRAKGLSGIGFEMAAAVAGFTLIGYWWDRHFGSSPWGLLTCAALGLIGGTYNLIRQSQTAFKREAGSSTKKPDGDPQP
ncbi:MAG TPA: AtpZ/AtpI family protein [Thermoanaerobaculia bacterium]|nr:AtpZ/AtpI family protein [Thermoanaerobaculia bacterium]